MCCAFLRFVRVHRDVCACAQICDEIEKRVRLDKRTTLAFDFSWQELPLAKKKKGNLIDRSKLFLEFRVFLYFRAVPGGVGGFLFQNERARAVLRHFESGFARR